MKLIFIRHGEPDYSIDSLTETGWREAELLAERMAKTEVTEYFVSPLGRAGDTARATLEKTGRTARVLPWLEEFTPRVLRPDRDEPTICWDWLPQDWLADERFLDRRRWSENDVMANGGVRQEYDRVVRAFDDFLAEHGYVRDGLMYRAERPSHDTLAFFCHLAITGVLMSRLMNVSPMAIWQSFAPAPTSVTIFNTEERRSGKAVFRASCVGDISHLYAAGQSPSFAGRFCEVNGDGDRTD